MSSDKLDKGETVSATGCIPTWTYDGSYYEKLVSGIDGLIIRTDPIKGKGLFATKDFKKNSHLLIESAMCCSQNVDDFVSGIPVCGMCLLSLETPKQIVRRIANKQLASELPHHDCFGKLRPPSVPCTNAEKGCSMVFCSHRCRTTAWEKFHYAGCPGTMDQEGKVALNQFVRNPWQQGGVDYSDTHFLAFRFLCQVMTQVRLFGATPLQGYASINQLIRAPLKKFNFSFLLRDDHMFGPTVKSTDEELRRKLLWKQFLHYKWKPEEEPQVMKMCKDGIVKDSLIKEGIELLKVIFRWSPSECEFFNTERWSTLLGSVLLNGQERSPNSPFVEHSEMVHAISVAEGREFKEWCRKSRLANFESSKFHSSTRGQGIYPIGCLFNHSCEPNLQVVYSDRNDETLIASAMKDIKAGDEVCISYINEDMHFTERQQQLFEHYLFECRCTKCLRELPQNPVPSEEVPSKEASQPVEETAQLKQGEESDKKPDGARSDSVEIKEQTEKESEKDHKKEEVKKESA